MQLSMLLDVMGEPLLYFRHSSTTENENTDEEGSDDEGRSHDL